MATPSPLLSPDRARCHVLRLATPTPVWRWDDVVTIGLDNPAQPPLPFDRDSEDPEPVGTADIPSELRRLASGLGRAIAEALSGRRAAAQLAGWLDDPPLAVLSAATRDYRGRTTTVASLRLQRTPGGSYEVSLRLRRGHGFSAAAFRLEERRGRWHCSALVVGP